MSLWSEELGTVGVWRGSGLVDVDLARGIEDAGYGTLWLGGSPDASLVLAEEVLGATERLRVATGIVNIWKDDAAELAASWHRVEERRPGRLLLGVGSGHREATPERVNPVDAMERYLDVLDREGVPVQRRLVSALGPRMLRLARERSAGTHPYLTVPTQTAEARAVLGPGALVAPEQTVVLDPDPASARASAREFLSRYLRMSNYANTMVRGGLSPEDLEDGGSDRLVDAIVAHGDAGAIAARVRSHLAAGADHVCVQAVPARHDPLPALRDIAWVLAQG